MPKDNLMVHLAPAEREYFDVEEYRRNEGFREEDYEEDTITDDELFGEDNPK